MRIKLKVSTDPGCGEIYDVIDDLEQHLGKNMPHERMTMSNFFIGWGWAIDHCRDHWTVRMLERRGNHGR